jgi:hypothetical protein
MRRLSVGFVCALLKKKKKIINPTWSHSSRLKVTWNDLQVGWSRGTWPNLTWLGLGSVSRFFGFKSQVVATLDCRVMPNLREADSLLSPCRECVNGRSEIQFWMSWWASNQREKSYRDVHRLRVLYKFVV